MDIFKKLKELDFPVGEYVVISGGVLAALGLRETNDLDIAVTEKLAKDLRSSGRFKEEIRHDQLYLLTEDVEIITRLNWKDYPTTVGKAISTAVIIYGFPFMNIHETIKFKKALGRDKDFKDIELLEAYSSGNK